MNEFKVCDKCACTNIKTLVPKLKKLDPKAEVIIGCHSFCGPGSLKPFVIVNDRTVFASTEDEVIDKVKKIID